MDCCLEPEQIRRKELPLNARRAYAGESSFSRKQTAIESGLYRRPIKQIANRYGTTLELNKQWTVVCVFHANISSLEQEFQNLASKWKRETRHSSVIAKRYQNPFYKAILDKGFPVVPLILKDLRHDPDRWFAALEKLTGENPAKDSENFYEAVDRWIAWGIAKGYVD